MSYTEQIESNYFNKWYYNYANDHIDGINKEGLSKLLDHYYKFKEPQELESGTWTALSEDVPLMTNKNYCKYVNLANAGNEDLNQPDCNDLGADYSAKTVNSLSGNDLICITESTDLCESEEEHIINGIPYKFTPRKKKDIVKNNSTVASCTGNILCENINPSQSSDCPKGCLFSTTSGGPMSCGSNIISCDTTDVWNANKTLDNCSHDTCKFSPENQDTSYNELSDNICKIQKINYMESNFTLK